MQLKLEIISFQQSLMGEGYTHTFDASGGSIGRNRDNAWVLPDPNRYVSSCHAIVDFADGQFRIIDTSTNGVFVNGSGTALGRDQRTSLSDGDRLVLGDYEIAVRLQDARRQAKPSAPVTLARPTGGLGVGESQPPQDILDVVGRTRTEPRLGRPTGLTEPPTTSGLPKPPPRPRSTGPLPPSPPRPSDPPPVLSATSGIPEDFDLPPAARPTAARSPAPASPPQPILPGDLDDLLPGSTQPDRPSPRVSAPPEPALIDRSTTPAPATAPAPPGLPDDLDDLLRVPVARRPGPAPTRVLPEGVPLLRPVPGTGNGPDPLSPSPPAVPPAVPPAARPTLGDHTVATALADGLGLDRDALTGLDPLATVTLTSRAARAAALGIADALDARTALARAAGIDPRALDRGGENPFVVYRSGEEALKRSLAHGSGQSQSLDVATRQSVATLTVNAAAAAAALEAVLDRLDGDAPPRTSAEFREIFGTAFLNAYHREISRLA